MAYLVLNGVLAFWLLIDALSRNMKATSVFWAIGTFLVGPLFIPIYLAKRPLKFGEVREGGSGWNVLKNFAVLWTIIMAAATVYFLKSAGDISEQATDTWSRAGAGLGILFSMAVLGAIWFFPAVGAAVLGFFIKKASIVETGPTGPLLESQAKASLLSGWTGIGGAAVIALIAVMVLGAKPSSSTSPSSEVPSSENTAVSSPTPSTPSTKPTGWMSNESRSEMDGTREVTLSLDSDTTVEGIIGTITPTLYIRCSKHKPEVFIHTGSPFQSVYGEFETTRVRVKFDDAAPIGQIWSEATNNEAAFAPSPAKLIKQLSSASTFRFEFTPFERRETIASFSVRDLGEKLKPLSELCGIQPAELGSAPVKRVSAEPIEQ